MTQPVKSYTRPAPGFLVGPPDAPDEVVDVKEYNRAMAALENADAAVERLSFDNDICRGCGVDRAGDWQGEHAPNCWVETAVKGKQAQ